MQSFAAGREASVRERPITSIGGGSGLRLPLLPAGRDVAAMYGSLRLPEVDVRRFYAPMLHAHPRVQTMLPYGTCIAGGNYPCPRSVGEHG